MVRAPLPPEPGRSTAPEAASGRHIRGSSLLLAGRLIGALVNFAIQIIIVRQLAKADYGAFAYGFAFMMFGAHVVGLGLDKSLSRFVPIYQERREFDRMAGTVVFVCGIITACGAALIAAVYGLAGLIGDHVAPDPLALSMLLILVCMVPVQALDDQTVKLFAIFASPRAVFFRRYVLTPGLKLAAVLSLVVFQGGPVFLAVAYLTAGLVGVLVSVVVLAGVLRQQALLGHFRPGALRMPVRELVRFGIPLLSTNLVHALRGNLVVLLLGILHSSVGVATFRAVLPVARLNVLVFDSFKLLFMPTAARMYARGDLPGINELYWRSASWIVVLTFPIFAVSFAFAEPLTLLLFGERYADSTTVLALLAFGMFVNAAFGFNALTLQVLHEVRTILRIDLTVVALAIVLNFVLIREFGALGGALASCGVLVLQNALYQGALIRRGAVEAVNARFARVLGTALAAAAALLALDLLLSPSIWVALPASALVSLLVVWITGPQLDAATAFPELRRVAAARWLFGIPLHATEPGGSLGGHGG